MAGSTFGNIYRVTTWGESHGAALGAVIDGCPAGIPMSEEFIQEYLDRRKPGQSQFTTSRREGDKAEILSGIFDGVTLGTPISVLVRNSDQHSNDYSNIEHTFRPGHADLGFTEKYGFRDYRGGGRSSGRETIGRVIGGAIASEVLYKLGISVKAYTRSIGPIEIRKYDETVMRSDPLCMPDADASREAQDYIAEKVRDHDSVGGIIECRIEGLPVGIGEPVFDKLDAELAKAVMSIGAVKGFEIGDGFAVARSLGSENNDAFYMKDGFVQKKTNHSGGTLGGMSDGDCLILRCAVKPTPSIAKEQKTVNDCGEEVNLKITGRHDPVIVPRAVVVVESMAAMTVLDMMLRNTSAKIDTIEKAYRNCR